MDLTTGGIVAIVVSSVVVLLIGVFVLIETMIGTSRSTTVIENLSKVANEGTSARYGPYIGSRQSRRRSKKGSRTSRKKYD